MNVLFVAGVLPEVNPFADAGQKMEAFALQLSQIGFLPDVVLYPKDLSYLALPFAFSAATEAVETKSIKKGCKFSEFTNFMQKKVPANANVVVFLHRSDLNFLLFDLTGKQNPFLKPLDWLHVEIYDWFKGCSKLHSQHGIAETALNFLSV
jgi:hypothetical protein